MNQIETKWDDIKNFVKNELELSEVAFNTWLKPLEVHSVEGNTLYILVPGEQMLLNYIKKKFELQLKVAVAELTGTEYDIHFILPDEAKFMNQPAKVLSVEEINEKTNLNPNYTFESFVVGSNNRFAHAASLAVAESPGEVYNPLFIHGGVGLGKTHLMHSIAHYIQAHNPSLRVLYVSSETFTNEVIDSIRNGNSSSMSKFRDKYRNIDVLLVDDVQFIIGKESTQEEFFHTFNELHLAKKQIILSSDRPPKEMETLEERIRSRFECGLLADIGVPDYETRMAILRRKQETDGTSIDDEILDYIATNIKSNVRELEGALNKLLAFANLQNTKITLEIAQKELQNIISPDKPKEITAQLIIEVVSDHFQISMDQMISKNRSSEIARPRQIAMYLCMNMVSEVSLGSVGALLGGRDHSTIIHGVKKIADEIEKDETMAATIETIKKKINPS
ncbi:chromosomal replication initiator protein [Lachnospiraceae bacterium XBB1006]|nr:chromosomal replication initiator protein [Lachnospiraceae bacterium XBB1006]